MMVELRVPRIEAKPKRVELAKRWRDTIGLEKKPHLENALIDIIEAIKLGRSLPSGCYRKNIDSTPDKLLVAQKKMHPPRKADSTMGSTES